MTILGFFSLMGGVGLFLYGMSIMSSGLKNAAGDKMKLILDHATSNRLISVLIGTAVTLLIAPLVTAALRSSSGGSFTSTCIVAAIVAAVGCASMLLVPKLNPMQRQQQ